jgi:iron(III) transport system ATP-binding protein
MNKGRIEQVDAPFEQYARPRTRFVAGFIGRTNFLEGRAERGDVDFGAFAVPRAALGVDAGPADKIVVSLRPQAMRLLREAPPAPEGRCGARGRVQRRAYLGESWDYQVHLEGLEEPVRVSTRAQDVFQAGDAVYVQIDPAQLTVIR